MNTWEEALETVEKYGAFEPDWDGQGAASIPPQILEGARRFIAMMRIRRVDPPASVMVGPDGSIDFHWADLVYIYDYEIINEKYSDLMIISKKTTPNKIYHIPSPIE